MHDTLQTNSKFYVGADPFFSFYGMPIFGKNFKPQYRKKYLSDCIVLEIYCALLQDKTFFFFDQSCPGTSLKSYDHIRQNIIKASYLCYYAC